MYINNPKKKPNTQNTLLEKYSLIKQLDNLQTHTNKKAALVDSNEIEANKKEIDNMLEDLKTFCNSFCK